MTQKRNRQNGTFHHLRSIERKLDIILDEIDHISARLFEIERQQRKDFTDATLTRLNDMARQMEAISVIELQNIRNLYSGTKEGERQ